MDIKLEHNKAAKNDNEYKNELVYCIFLINIDF